MNRYDLSGSGYSQKMSSLQNRYKAARNAAERERKRTVVPSKAEANAYQDAANICKEIMNMNLSQRDVYARWNTLYQDCLDEMESVLRALGAQISAAPVNAPADDTLKSAVHQPVVQSEPVKPQTAEPVSKSALDFEPVINYACKDVSAETIRGWFKTRPNHTLEDLTGMDAIKARLKKSIDSLGWRKTDAALRLSSGKGFLFYGLPGTGKTYMIEAVTADLMDKGFHFMKLESGDIKASLVGVAEKTVDIAFKTAVDNAPCVLFVDELDALCPNRSNANLSSHERSLTNAFLSARNQLKSTQNPVVFMGATNFPNDVDGAMLDSLYYFNVPLPSDEDREKYLKKNFGMFELEEGFSFDEMINATRDYSYRDLGKLNETLSQEIKEYLIQKNREEYGSNSSQEEKDSAISEQILSGNVVLTKEMFYESKKMYPPSNKAQNRAVLEAFEKRAGEADQA